MPVDDHPIHPKTVQAAGARYGCHNHPSRKGNGYYAPNRRYLPDGRFVLELVRIETEWIDYDVCPAASDHPCCEGCVHKAQPACVHVWSAAGYDQFQNHILRCERCGETRGGK